MDYCATGTVRGEPWYSDGVIMLKGVTDQKADRAGITMDLVFDQATKNLKPAKGLYEDRTSYAHPVMRTIYDLQIVQPKYAEMIQKLGKVFVGGKFTCEPYNGEKFIVVKNRSQVVAICAPMRKP